MMSSLNITLIQCSSPLFYMMPVNICVQQLLLNTEIHNWSKSELDNDILGSMSNVFVSSGIEEGSQNDRVNYKPF